MRITYYGHSCLLIETNGKKLLVDPFISPNEHAKNIDVDGIRCDYVLVTHAHQDHVADLEKIMANNPEATIVSNYEIATHYGKQDFTTWPMNQGGHHHFDFGHCKYVAAIHSSSFPDGSYGGNPGGFVLWNDEGCVYIAGDTALTYDMQLIPITCPALDVAVLPIGDDFTMGYRDAVLACDFIECDRVLGCHYNTFPYIEIDTDTAKTYFDDHQKSLILLDPGATLDV